MLRTACVMFGLFLVSAPQVSGQEWAEKMFRVSPSDSGLSHDFGTVPRGGKVQHFFWLQNLYLEDVHIAAVRSSCGCTTPQVTKVDLKTHEKAAVVASFNTESFTGQRTATITVIIDKPYPAEVRLQVSGFIRTDLTLNPQGAAFGSISQGQTHEKTLEIQYTGSGNWQLTGIRVSNPAIEAEAVETQRRAGDVRYRMTVRVKGDAPAGYLKEQITVVTNDRSAATFPVEVEAQVVPPISVVPNSLFFGVVPSGEQVKRSIVVRGEKPFSLVEVTCADPRYAFEVTTGVEKTLHQIPVTFTAEGEAGQAAATIQIRVQQEAELVTELQAGARIINP